MQSVRRPLMTLGFVVLVLGLISGCESIAYYGQAAQGQMSLLLARESIAERLSQPSIPDAERRKLQLVLDARAFAEVCAAVCLAGELSIIGALCAHEFASAHKNLARGKA